MAKKEQQDEYFVGLTSPDDVKRGVLESSKELLGSMKGVENLKDIREEKKEEIANLKKIVKSSSLLMSKIKNRLPKVHPLIKKTEKEEEPAVSRPVRMVSEVDRLQSELDEIEKKLNSL